MEVELLVKQKFNLKTIFVNAYVRYFEDSEVNGVEDTDGNLMPFLNGHSWIFKIDADTGVIIDWPKGTVANVHYKVCDRCSIGFSDENGNSFRQEYGYVPRFLCPKEAGYGVYIIMDILEDGKIDNFVFTYDFN